MDLELLIPIVVVGLLTALSILGVIKFVMKSYQGS